MCFLCRSCLLSSFLKYIILSGDDDNVGLNVLRCWADTLGTIVEKIS